MEPKPMQDIKPPEQNPISSSTQLVEAEVKTDIPVKDQGTDSAGSANPIESKQFIEEESHKGDSELEGVLKDVNEDVKKSGQTPARTSIFKRLHPSKSKQQKKVEAKPKETSRQPRPTLAIVAAVIVAAGLNALAFHVYSGDQNTTNITTKNSSAVKASSSNAKNLVKPADLSDLSSSMASKLSSFNDAQDFNSSDLSDKALGL
jgi:hypothetical protein